MNQITLKEYTPPSEEEVDTINSTKRSESVKHKLFNTKPRTPDNLDETETRIYEFDHIFPDEKRLKMVRHHLDNAIAQNKKPSWMTPGDMRKQFKYRTALDHKDRRMIPAIHGLAISRHPRAEQINAAYQTWRQTIHTAYKSLPVPKLKDQKPAERRATEKEIEAIYEHEIATFEALHSEIMRLLDSADS